MASGGFSLSIPASSLKGDQNKQNSEETTEEKENFKKPAIDILQGKVLSKTLEPERMLGNLKTCPGREACTSRGDPPKGQSQKSTGWKPEELRAAGPGQEKAAGLSGIQARDS
jgi:hypothetical protein